MVISELKRDDALIVPVRSRHGEVDVEIAATGLVDVYLTDAEGVEEAKASDDFTYYERWKRRCRVDVTTDLPRGRLYLLIFNQAGRDISVALEPR